jgi:hypothetical protein
MQEDSQWHARYCLGDESLDTSIDTTVTFGDIYGFSLEKRSRARSVADGTPSYEVN